MIVRPSAIAVSTWAMASQRPATMIQITLPMTEGAPGVDASHEGPTERPQREARDPEGGQAERDRDDQ